MRQLNHLSPELAERFNKLCKVRDALETSQTTGHLVLGKEELFNNYYVR